MNRYLLAFIFLLLLLFVFGKVKMHRESSTMTNIAPFHEAHKGLAIGDRLCIFGGYDNQPPWLGGKQYYAGTIVKFIPSQRDGQTAVVLKADEEIKVDEHKGQYLILKTRWVGQDWKKYGPVHLELCDFEPDSLSYEQRQKGEWIEAAASYEFEDIFIESLRK